MMDDDEEEALSCGIRKLKSTQSLLWILQQRSERGRFWTFVEMLHQIYSIE